MRKIRDKHGHIATTIINGKPIARFCRSCGRRFKNGIVILDYDLAFCGDCKETGATLHRFDALTGAREEALPDAPPILLSSYFGVQFTNGLQTGGVILRHRKAE